ncbi:MAG: 16S rRNA (adenine(1518)-N(6)/adenine(1519)-N(6))-dimethyltransferase, partial [Bacteroidales bacterium]|nr:16S rRNA (adenine(1518)-N(6)/adenine(1519)-N(6))-dimethyltransferase [Bacteroidales bacterium]
AIQILGNFPYNISSQILFRVMEYRDLVQEVTGMFQKEVAQRIAAPPGSKTYGILSVLLQAFYTIEYLFTVNESVFTPPPKVKSAVIRLVRNDVQSLDCDEKFWVIVVKTAFNQRRKTLRNSVRKLVPPEFTQLDDPIFDLRPERLSVSDFVRLTQMLLPESSEK